MIHSQVTYPWYIAMTIIFEISKTVFPGTYFGFDICNPKLFTSKNRSSILPSPQNINLIQFLMILMSTTCHIRKMSKISFDNFTHIKNYQRCTYIVICCQVAFWYLFGNRWISAPQIFLIFMLTDTEANTDFVILMGVYIRHFRCCSKKQSRLNVHF